MLRDFATLFIFYYYLCNDNPLNKAYHFASDRWPATPPVHLIKTLTPGMRFANVSRLIYGKDGNVVCGALCDAFIQTFNNFGHLKEKMGFLRPHGHDSRFFSYLPISKIINIWLYLRRMLCVCFAHDMRNEAKLWPVR